MNWRRYWDKPAVRMVTVLLLGAVWIALTRMPHPGQGGPPPAPRQGFAAPDFTLTAVDGATVNLHDLRGKAVVLNFWATWCAPCKAEMPALQRVYADRRADGVVMLAVTVETDAEAVAAFGRRYDLTFPLLLDAGAQVSHRYQVQGTPTTFFIDRQGIIRSVVVGGPMSEALIRSKIDDLLTEGR